METFDQRKILRHLSYVCLSVRPFVVITIASERKVPRTSKFANRLLLVIDRIENELFRSTESGTSHINQTGIGWSWAHGKSAHYDYRRCMNVRASYLISLLSSIYESPSPNRHPRTRPLGVTCSPKKSHYCQLDMTKFPIF